MSAAKTGTPWALSCSASSCRVLVLPVPVAPATSPCRLSMASGIRIVDVAEVVGVQHQAAELERRPLEGIAGCDGRGDRIVGTGTSSDSASVVVGCASGVSVMPGA